MRCMTSSLTYSKILQPPFRCGEQHLYNRPLYLFPRSLRLSLHIGLSHLQHATHLQVFFAMLPEKLNLKSNTSPRIYTDFNLNVSSIQIFVWGIRKLISSRRENCHLLHPMPPPPTPPPPLPPYTFSNSSLPLPLR